jgi:hypothetical protein
VKETDFGRGYATCLFQFVMHEARLSEQLRMHKEAGYPESSTVELWANGASDHLYELITGPRVKSETRILAKALAAVVLDCGHGFRKHDWSEAQALSWIATAKVLLVAVGDPQTIEDAMAIDVGLGLLPDRGAYSCSFNREGV